MLSSVNQNVQKSYLKSNVALKNVWFEIKTLYRHWTHLRRHRKNIVENIRFRWLLHDLFTNIHEDDVRTHYYYMLHREESNVGWI